MKFITTRYGVFKNIHVNNHTRLNLSISWTLCVKMGLAVWYNYRILTSNCRKLQLILIDSIRCRLSLWVIIMYVHEEHVVIAKASKLVNKGYSGRKLLFLYNRTGRIRQQRGHWNCQNSVSSVWIPFFYKFPVRHLHQQLIKFMQIFYTPTELGQLVSN